MEASGCTSGHSAATHATARCSPVGSPPLATAGEKGVTVMGGADTGQQYLRAGLLDELSIHLIPVLFGSGTRMFDHLDDKHVELEPGETIQTPAATHLRYRVVRKTDA